MERCLGIIRKKPKRNNVARAAPPALHGGISPMTPAASTVYKSLLTTYGNRVRAADPPYDYYTYASFHQRSLNAIINIIKKVPTDGQNKNAANESLSAAISVLRRECSSC